jgi:hypothetical protein
MFCTKCGQQFTDISHSFCPKCGFQRTSVISEPVRPQVVVPDKPIQQPLRVSKRSKQTAIGIAVIAGPFAYAYLMKTHRAKLVIYLILGALAGIPIAIAVFGDPAYWNVLSAAFGDSNNVSFVDSGSSPHVISAWSYYLTPLGLVTVGLNVILRAAIIVDLLRLPNSFYENYKE